MLWNEDLDFEIASYNNHHIDTIIRGIDGRQWRCSEIYGHPEVGQKRHTWTLLRRQVGLFTYPWICYGDFNEILNLNEKTGGNDRNLSMVADFKEVINECKLSDIECRGYPFTWSNRRFGPHFVEEKLDRFLGSQEWEVGGIELIAYNLDLWCSDHSLVMLKMQERNKGNKWVVDEEEVEKQFCEYFAELFTSTKPTTDHISAALSDLGPTVTVEMNQQLDNPFTVEEVFATLS
ncbi:hypothetical protein KPL71_021975 [Citrus sinensis]|uniref:Uncharacterized protein n=1 Tax=Citrus sinensis TaxID=2711 RepID=A0ACB8JJR4_CITSI|nr:hypothetical protein KPL71_021975 [Citrus sinensis]